MCHLKVHVVVVVVVVVALSIGILIAGRFVLTQTHTVHCTTVPAN